MALVLVRSEATPSGIGIGITDTQLGAFSGCCGAQLLLGPPLKDKPVADFTARGWYCKFCSELKSRCHRARVVELNKSNTHIQEWLADWTGWSYGELHVEKS